MSMSLAYHVIEIFTSEEARYKGAPLHRAIVQFVREQKMAARCIVQRGISGCYENGEIATQGVEILSYNMPLKIEIILPAPELNAVLPVIEEMVTDGIVVVEDMRVCSHRVASHLIPRQLRVRDAMTPSPSRVTAGTPLSEVVRLILRGQFNAVPVVDDAERPVGIVTQGDLIHKGGMPVRKGLLAEFDEGQVREIVSAMDKNRIADIMSKPVVTIPVDAPLDRAVGMMIQRHVKRIPVVDQSGTLVGILARFDIFKAIGRETPDWRALQSRRVELGSVHAVRDIMQRQTPTVRPDAPLEEVIRVIDTSDIQRAAVVDADGRFLGLISDSALLGLMSKHRGGVWDYLVSKLPFSEIGKHRRELLDQLRAHTAADVMKKDVVVVAEDTLIDEAIRLFTEKNIKRLPVIDAHERFLGIVSRDDVLRLGVSTTVT
jgi:CBS domain-containing protein